MTRSTTGFQPCKLMFGHKALQSDMHGLGWQITMTIIHSKCEWVKQHELILAVNRCALITAEQSAEKSVSQAGSKALYIPIITWYYYMTIQKIETRYKIILKANYLLGIWSTGNLMFTTLSHLMGRVLCIWWTLAMIWFSQVSVG